LQSGINRLRLNWHAGCLSIGMTETHHEPFCPMRQPVLIVLHGELSTPGRVAIQLRNRDIPLDVRRPRFGDDLPKTLKDHSGVVIFGGPQSANDDDEVVRREIDWIEVPLKENKPYLGICLGAQMLAKKLGARVYKHSDGHAEVGYYPIRPTPAGRTVCKDWPDHVYQWHREGFDLPDKGVMLAEGDSFPVQAFSYGGRAYALQFHVDVTHATMCRWTTRGHERLSAPNAKPREAHFEGRLLHDPACRAWLTEFIDHWLNPPANEELPVSDRGSSRHAQPRLSKVSTR
jgi:GMP synthase (glutamine-hydrolysing)